MMKAKDARAAIKDAPVGGVYLLYSLLGTNRTSPITKGHAIDLIRGVTSDEMVPFVKRPNGNVLIVVDAVIG